MGRKRKRHSAEQSYGGTPSQEQEMRVVLRLPGAYEEEDEEEQTWSSSLHHHHPSHYHSGVAEPPVECVVSIPLPLLRQAAQSQASEPATSSDQHKHKKHKKKKKHRHSHEAAAPTPDPPSQSASQESFQPFIEHPPLPKLTLPKPSPAAVLPSSERGPSSQSGLIASDDPDRKHHSHRHKHHHHHHKKSRHSEEGASLAPKQEWLSPPIAAAAATRPPPVELFQQTPRLGGSSSEISPPVLPPAPLDSGHKHKKKKKKHKHSRSGSEHSLSQTAFSGTRPSPGAVPLVPPYSSPSSLSGKSLATAPPEHLPSVKRVRISEDVALPPPPVLKPVVPAAVKELQKPEKIVTFSEPTPLASLSSKPHHPPHPPHPHRPPQPEAIAVRSQAAEVQLKTHAGSLIHSTVRPATAVAPPPAGHMRPHPSPQKEMKPFKSKPVVVTAPPPPPPTSTPHQSHRHTDTTSTQPPTKTLQVNLSRTALKLFLKNLHHQIQKRDLEGIFIEPVTDDIAPGYSSIIAHSMDLGTMASKIENSDYTAVSEFKDDFALMCNNAMTYNTPDTVYYATAKKLLSSGLKIIAKEVSMRPDILHGKVLSSAATSRAGSASPLPDFRLPLPSSAAFDYASPCVCRIELGALRSARSQAPLLLPPPPQTLPPTSLLAGLAKSLAAVPRPELVSTALETATPLTDQSHLTKVSVGVVDDEPEMGVVGGAESPEEVLVQVREAAEAAKENLGSTRPPVRLCYVERDQHSNRTMLNFINPDTSEVDSSRPVDLSVLSEQVRMGNNAATVLKTELPMMKATPVSYLMYGPFGSFAPAYDSTFATLSKMDSDLLLSSYSSDIGVSYAHSLQQFVKGTGSFVSEMADAVLNGLTNGRHSKFTEKFRSFEESERRAKASLRLDGGGGGGGGGGKAGKELSQRVERPSSTPLPASGNGQKNDDDVVIISPSSSRGDSPCERPPSLDGASLVDDGPSSPPSRLAAPAGSIAAGNGRLPLQDATEEGETVVLDGGVVDRELFEGESPGEDEGGLSSLGGGEISSSGRGSSSSSSGSSSGGSSEGRGLSPSSPPSEPNSNSEVANNQEQLCTVSSRLQQTSELLGTLQEQQRQRLAQPPRLDADTGHVLLPGPSREEISTASRLGKELASMTSQVRPQDVVTVAGIQKAMGVSLQQPEPTSLPTHTDPSSSS